MTRKSAPPPHLQAEYGAMQRGWFCRNPGVIQESQCSSFDAWGNETTLIGQAANMVCSARAGVQYSPEKIESIADDLALVADYYGADPETMAEALYRSAPILQQRWHQDGDPDTGGIATRLPVSV